MSLTQQGQTNEHCSLEAIRLFAQRTEGVLQEISKNEVMISYPQLGKVGYYTCYFRFDLTQPDKTPVAWNDDVKHKLAPMFERLFRKETVDLIANNRDYRIAGELKFSKEMRACIMASRLLAKGVAADAVLIEELPNGNFDVSQLVPDIEEGIAEPTLG